MIESPGELALVRDQSCVSVHVCVGTPAYASVCDGMCAHAFVSVFECARRIVPAHAFGQVR